MTKNTIPDALIKEWQKNMYKNKQEIVLNKYDYSTLQYEKDLEYLKTYFIPGEIYKLKETNNHIVYFTINSNKIQKNKCLMFLKFGNRRNCEPFHFSNSSSFFINDELRTFCDNSTYAKHVFIDFFPAYFLHKQEKICLPLFLIANYEKKQKFNKQEDNLNYWDLVLQQHGHYKQQWQYKNPIEIVCKSSLIDTSPGRFNDVRNRFVHMKC